MDTADDRVIRIFNEMAPEYDNLADLWYSWLVCRLHYFIADWVARFWPSAKQTVLDVGCGTGFQSHLYAEIGAEVCGIDVAGDLIEVAKAKTVEFLQTGKVTLFPSYYGFVDEYNAKVRDLLAAHFSPMTFCAPRFETASAIDLPYEDAAFTHVNCCGSVLSFIPQYELALDEIARVLAPGGTFVLEVEGRYNADAVWPLMDCLLRGKLEYDTTFEEALSVWRRPLFAPVSIEYPFGEISNPVYMPITLFTRRQLHGDLQARSLVPLSWKTIHSITNLIPSTVLDSPKPTKLTMQTFAVLSKLEGWIPLALPGCSLVVFGQKRDPAQCRNIF